MLARNRENVGQTETERQTYEALKDIAAQTLDGHSVHLMATWLFGGDGCARSVPETLSLARMNNIIHVFSEYNK